MAIIDLTEFEWDPCHAVEAAAELAEHVPVVVVRPPDGPPPAALVATSTEPDDLIERAIERTTKRWARRRATARSAGHLASRAIAREHWGQHVRRWADELLHEVRTPVAIVQGFCSNLRDGLHGDLNDEQQAAVDRILAAASHLSVLLTNAGEDQPAMPGEEPVADPRAARRTRLSLEGLCAEVVAMFEPKADERSIRLDLDAVPCPTIWGERTRLTQLLVNLVSNALRFTPSRGAVTVTLRPGQGGRHCRITVSDTGPGIPHDVRDRIFRTGFTTDMGSGHAGMGLSICKDVAREHGGWIRADRAEKGASFTVEIPIDPRNRRARVHVDVLEHPAALKKIFAELADQQVPIDQYRVSDIDAFAAELVERGGRITVTNIPSTWRTQCHES